MAASDQQEVLVALREIRQKLELLSTPLEDILANRVVDKARTQIKLWIGVWTAIAVALLGWSGYNFNQAVNEIKNRAQSEVVTQATKDLENNIKVTLDKQVQDILANAQTQIDRATHDFLKSLEETNKRVDALALAVGKRLNDSQIEGAVQRHVNEPLHAFAFYGRIVNGVWVEGPYFRPTTGNPKTLPRAGDDVVATGDVYARSGYVTYAPSQGWINQPAVGLIHRNERLHVIEAKIIHDGFSWMQFVRQP